MDQDNNREIVLNIFMFILAALIGVGLYYVFDYLGTIFS